jgi:Beta/Gamma crystallin
MKVYGTIENAENEKPLKGAMITLSVGDTQLIENSPAVNGYFDYNIPDSVVPRGEELLTCKVKKDGFRSQTATYNMIGDEVEIALELFPESINWKRIIRIIAIVMAALLLLVLIGIGIYYLWPRPPASPVITQFKAEPAEISPGGETTIHWQTHNTKSVYLDDQQVSPEGSRLVVPEKTAQYTLTIKDGDEVVLQKLRKVAVLPPPQILNFTVTPNEINLGQSVTLEWEATHADSFYISEGSEDKEETDSAIKTANGKRRKERGKPRDFSGSHQVTHRKSDTYTYTIVAVNRLGKKAVKKIDLKVWETPQIKSFSASPKEIKPGGTVTLSWTTKGAVQTFLDEVQTSPNFTTQVTPTKTTTYTLKVSNKLGERKSNVKVTVIQPKTIIKPGPIKPPQINRFLATPVVIARGESVTLSWVTQYARKVFLDDKQVALLGSKEVCPEKTTIYTIKACNSLNTTQWERKIEVIDDSCTIFLYELENYNGKPTIITTDTAQLDEFDNSVSSIKIIGRGSVIVYSAPNFKATRQEFSQSMPSLRGTWIGNNTISSIKVIKR